MPTKYTRNHNCMVAVIGKLPGEAGVTLQNKNSKWQELYDGDGELKDIDIDQKKDKNTIMAQKLGAFDLIIGRTVHNRKYQLSFDGDKKLCVDSKKSVEKEITGEIGWWVISKSWLIKNSSDHQSVKNLLKAVNGRRDISDALVSCIQGELVRFLDLKDDDKANVDGKYIVPERVRKMVTTTMADKTGKVFHWWPGFRIRCWQFMGQVSKRHLYKYGASDGVGTPQVPRTINRISAYPELPVTDGGVNYKLLFDEAIYKIPFIGYISRGGFRWEHLWDIPNEEMISGYLGTKDEFKNMFKEMFKKRFKLTEYSEYAIDSLNLHDVGGGYGNHFITYGALESFFNGLEENWIKFQIMYYKPDKYAEWYDVGDKSKKLTGAISSNKVVLFPDIATLQSEETVESMGKINSYLKSPANGVDDIEPYTGVAIPNDKWVEIKKSCDLIVLDSKGEKYYKLPMYSEWKFSELLHK